MTLKVCLFGSADALWEMEFGAASGVDVTEEQTVTIMLSLVIARINSKFDL